MSPASAKALLNPDIKGAPHYSTIDGQRNYKQESHTTNHLVTNGGTTHHLEDNNISRMTQPTPLFERLVTEEVQELKAYARIIENQNRRLAELERVHSDLNSRLVINSKAKTQLETTLEERELQWALKFQELEADRDRLKEVVKVEQTKNARLRDEVVRKDQDIQRMLLRKVSLHRCLKSFFYVDLSFDLSSFLEV